MPNLNLLTRLAALLALCALASCGSRGAERSAPEPAAEAGPAGALPGLGELPPAPRELSEIPPDGYLPLDPLYPIFSANAVDGGGYLKLDNAAGVQTYAVFAVGGFDGDNYPVGVKLEVGAGGAPFYLAFSNYLAGRWEITGPFTGDGEFGIPALDGNDHPGAFTSDSRTHYFALIAPAGSGVNLDALWLGVNGGANGPQPAFGLDGSGSGNGFYLHWNHSVSYNDPDFAGYVLERAPAFSGNFSPVSGSPAPATYFLDSGAAFPETYRYRVVTYDTAGNAAAGSAITEGPGNSEEADPVIIVDLPRGPLMGPADVTIDLSGSFDPEGEGIVSYATSFYSPALSTYNNPQLSLSFQPGCHALHCRVDCADGRSADAYFYLKVLPQWEPASRVLWATDPTNNAKYPRLLPFRAANQPADGRITICGQDTTANALTFWHFDGAELKPYRCPWVERATYIGEGLAVGDSLVFPFATESAFMFASFDGAETAITPLTSSNGHRPIALVEDGAGILWAIHADDDTVIEKLTIRKFGPESTPLDLVIPADAVSFMDAVYQPSSGHIFALYDDGLALHFAEWDPATQTVVASGPLGPPIIGSFVDAEINPENGRVGVIYRDPAPKRIRYVEQDGGGGWKVPQTIDNSLDNEQSADLTPSGAGRLCTCFSLSTGQLHRYELGSGVWTSINTASYSAASGYDLATCPVPGSPDIRIADNCDDGAIRLARLGVGNTDNVFATLDSAIGQGNDMHAATGFDGLHLIFLRANSPFNETKHLRSAAGAGQGLVWGEEDAFFASGGLNLSGSPTGPVYATGYLTGLSTLYYWDSAGAAWTNDNALTSQAPHRPILGPDWFSGDVAFGVWDELAGQFQVVTGNHLGYSPPAFHLLDTAPVWEGRFVSGVIGDGWLCLAGGTHDQSSLAFFDGVSLESDNLFYAAVAGELSPYDKPSVRGRLLDTAAYWDNSSTFIPIGEEWLCANGSLLHPVRFTKTIFGTRTSTDLPMNTVGGSPEIRRSVCAEMVGGPTAVELVATLGGEKTWFAWSNFGDFEELALPPGLDGLSLPLVACGNDGRWHIIYKNWKTDAIMIRSTV